MSTPNSLTQVNHAPFHTFSLCGVLSVVAGDESNCRKIKTAHTQTHTVVARLVPTNSPQPNEPRNGGGGGGLKIDYKTHNQSHSQTDWECVPAGVAVRGPEKKKLLA